MAGALQLLDLAPGDTRLLESSLHLGMPAQIGAAKPRCRIRGRPHQTPQRVPPFLGQPLRTSN
jgi:hypothetical protein